MNAKEPDAVEELDAAEDWESGDVDDDDLLDLDEVEVSDDIEDVDGEVDDEGAKEASGANDDQDDDEDEEALDELEAEELGMLTEDEASEVIQVDERREMRALRREEMALEADPEQPSEDEFVCQSCFLVKRVSQLVDKRRKLCSDCAGS